MSLDSDSDCEKEDEFDIANPAQIITSIVEGVPKEKLINEDEKIINSTQNNPPSINPSSIIISTNTTNALVNSNNANNQKNN